MGNNLYEHISNSEGKTSKSIADKVGGIFHRNRGRIISYAAAVLISGVGLGELGYLNDARAQRQVVCGDRDKIVLKLGKIYKEVPSEMGLLSTGMILEIFSSKKGERSFTVVVTYPSGKTCLVGSGLGWEDIPEISLDPRA